jgi:hypothetical protein
MASAEKGKGRKEGPWRERGIGEGERKASEREGGIGERHFRRLAEATRHEASTRFA